MLGGSHIKTGLYYGSRYNFFGFQNIGGGIGLYSKPFQWDINNNGLDLPLDNYFGAEASYLVVGAAFEFNVTQQWKLESWEFNLGPIVYGSSGLLFRIYSYSAGSIFNAGGNFDINMQYQSPQDNYRVPLYPADALYMYNPYKKR
jgi:hypothetical protein